MHFEARCIVALLFAFVLSSSSQGICRYDKEQISLCQEVMSPIPWQRAVPIFLPNDSVPSERAASLQNFARHACFLTPACMSAAIKVRLVLFVFSPLHPLLSRCAVRQPIGHVRTLMIHNHCHYVKNTAWITISIATNPSQVGN